MDNTASDIPIVEFEYDNTLEETEQTFAYFQRKFAVSTVIFAVLCLGLLVYSIVVVVQKPSKPLLYLAPLLIVFLLVRTLYTPYKIRKKLMKAISELDQPSFHARLFADRLEIQTFPREREENEVKLKLFDDKDREIARPPVSVHGIKGEKISFNNGERLIMLAINGDELFCFPKRCLTDYQQKLIINNFTE